MNDSERKRRIEQLREKVREIQQLLGELKEDCSHKIEKRYSSAYCSICGEDFGWWCPDSPDHVCHYYSEDGEVSLIDGTKVKKPKDASEDESDDWCIFCGDPEERK